MDNHYSMEMRTKEKLANLRKEGMLSQEARRHLGPPKWRLFISRLFSGWRSRAKAKGEIGSVEDPQFKPHTSDLYRNA